MTAKPAIKGPNNGRSVVHAVSKSRCSRCSRSERALIIRGAFYHSFLMPGGFSRPPVPLAPCKPRRGAPWRTNGSALAPTGARTTSAVCPQQCCNAVVLERNCTGAVHTHDIYTALNKIYPPLLQGASRTLAQRCGLVPGPAALLTPEQWDAVKERYRRRRGSDPLDDSFDTDTCAICREPFRDEQQLLLSCSHSFHAQCLACFERSCSSNTHAPALRRHDSSSTAHVHASRPRCCPLCRAPYQKQHITLAADAWHNRCATKIQAAFRGWRARSLYRAMLCAAPAPEHPHVRRLWLAEKLGETGRKLERRFGLGGGKAGRQLERGLRPRGGERGERRDEGGDDLDALFAEIDASVAASRQVYDAVVTRRMQGYGDKIPYCSSSSMVLLQALAASESSASKAAEEGVTAAAAAAVRGMNNMASPVPGPLLQSGGLGGSRPAAADGTTVQFVAGRTGRTPACQQQRVRHGPSRRAVAAAAAAAAAPAAQSRQTAGYAAGQGAAAGEPSRCVLTRQATAGVVGARSEGARRARPLAAARAAAAAAAARAELQLELHARLAGSSSTRGNHGSDSIGISRGGGGGGSGHSSSNISELTSARVSSSERHGAEAVGRSPADTDHHDLGGLSDLRGLGSDDRRSQHPLPPDDGQVDWATVIARACERGETECAVCLGALAREEGDGGVAVLSCSHVLHVQCVASFEAFQGFALGTGRCPVCRGAYVRRCFAAVAVG